MNATKDMSEKFDEIEKMQISSLRDTLKAELEKNNAKNLEYEEELKKIDEREEMINKRQTLKKVREHFENWEGEKEKPKNINFMDFIEYFEREKEFFDKPNTIERNKLIWYILHNHCVGGICGIDYLMRFLEKYYPQITTQFYKLYFKKLAQRNKFDLSDICDFKNPESEFYYNHFLRKAIHEGDLDLRFVLKNEIILMYFIEAKLINYTERGNFESILNLFITNFMNYKVLNFNQLLKILNIMYSRKLITTIKNYEICINFIKSKINKKIAKAEKYNLILSEIENYTLQIPDVDSIRICYERTKERIDLKQPPRDRREFYTLEDMVYFLENYETFIEMTFKEY